MGIKKVLLFIVDWIANIVIGIFTLIVLWFIAQLFFYAVFSIPTESMYPTLIPGDKIMVDKTVMGARLFDMFDALNGEEFKIHRSPGRGKLQSDDVIVFNFPYIAGWDSIAIDIRKYYAKRCVGVPGDTVEIRDCHYYINGVESEKLYNSSTERLEQFLSTYSDEPEMIRRQVVIKAFPNDTTVPWTISNFGPMFVPGKGSCINLDKTTATVYRNYIEWESGKKLLCEEDSVFLGGVAIDSYTFKENYYFVAGDNQFNSQDSRYFGLVPEPFVVGKAITIIYSINRYTGKKRSGRHFLPL